MSFKQRLSAFLVVAMVLSLFTSYPALFSSAAATLNSSVYYIDHSAGFVYDVDDGTTVAQLKDNFTNPTTVLTVYNASGTSLGASTRVTTGYTISNGDETATILVKGDNSGDGVISSVDVLSVSRYISGYKVFDETLVAASDIDYDSKVTTTDYAILRDHLAGRGDVGAFKHPNSPTGGDTSEEDSSEAESSVTAQTCTVSFTAGKGGTLSGITQQSVVYGTSFSSVTLPTVTCDSGYIFTGWTPSFPETVTGDISFVANFDEAPVGTEEINYASASNGGQYMFTVGAPYAPLIDSFDAGTVYGSGYLNDDERLTDTDDDWVEASRSNSQIVITVKLAQTITVTKAVINCGTMQWATNRVLPDSVTVYTSVDGGEDMYFGMTSAYTAIGDYGYVATVLPQENTAKADYVKFVCPMSAFIGRFGEVEVYGLGGSAASSYEISFSAGENGTLQGTTSFKLNAGTLWNDIKVPTPVANAGYKFVGWTPALPSNSSAVNADASYTAKFDVDDSQYVTVNFVAGENGSISGQSSITVVKGTSWSEITVPTATANAGYKFSSWSPSFPATITEDATYTANFTYDETQYATIKFVAGANGSISGTTSVTALIGSAFANITLPETTANTGYKFDSWSPALPATVTGDATYTANFVVDESQYATVTFVAGENGTISGTSSYTVLKGTAWSEITVPSYEANDGYKFVSWSPSFPESITESATYTANFVIDNAQYATVIFVAGANGTLDGTNTYTVLKGTSWNEIDVPTPVANAGYKFDSWSASFPTTITEDITYTASFVYDASQYATITFVAGANGTLSGTSTYTVLKGTAWSAITVPTATANAGYKFSAWSPTFPATITADATYTANFVYDESQYATVTFVAGSNGTISGTSKYTVLKGTAWSEITVPTATANAGYKFSAWSPTFPTTITATATYTANFVYDATQYATVSFVAGSNGTLSGTSTYTVLKGTAWSAITVPTATANAGYKFSAWSPSFPATVTESATYTANFVYDATQYATVSFAAGTNGTLSGATAFTVLKGTAWSSITVPSPVANEGYRFTAWNASFPSAVTTDVTFTAQFEKIPTYSIVFVAGSNGTLSGTWAFDNIEEGTVWSNAVTVPTPVANAGYVFDSWTPALPSADSEITASVTYTALFVVEEVGSYRENYASAANGGTYAYYIGNKLDTYDDTAFTTVSTESMRVSFSSTTLSFGNGLLNDNSQVLLNNGPWVERSRGSTSGFQAQSNVIIIIVKLESAQSDIEQVVVNLGNSSTSSNRGLPDSVTVKYTTRTSLSSNVSWTQMGNTVTSYDHISGYGYQAVIENDTNKAIKYLQITLSMSTYYAARLGEIEVLGPEVNTTVHSVNFVAGSNGSLSGTSSFAVPDGNTFGSITVPTPVANEGYRFSHWSPELPSSSTAVTSSAVYTAVFTEKVGGEEFNYALKENGGNYMITAGTVQTGFPDSFDSGSAYGSGYLNDGKWLTGTNDAWVEVSRSNNLIGVTFKLSTPITMTSAVMNFGLREGSSNRALPDSVKVYVGSSASNITTLFGSTTTITSTSDYGYNATVNGTAEEVTYVYFECAMSQYIGRLGEFEIWGAEGEVVPTYNVSFSAGANGTVSGSTYHTVVEGTKWSEIELPTVTANPGYVFSGWTPSLPASDDAITENLSFTANFTYDASQWRTVTFVAGTGGKLSGTTSVSVPTGTAWSAITVPTVVENDGYTFTGWTPSFPATVTTNATYTANFIETPVDQVVITFKAGTGGSLSGTTVFSVDIGSQWSAITVPTPVASSGYVFASWTPALPDSTAEIGDNMTFTANFIKDIGQTLEGVIYINGVNAGQYVSGGSHVYTINYGSAFTATYWEVYVAGYSEAKGGYIVTEKYASGSTKSVEVPTNGIVVAVHMGTQTQAACAYVDVGDLLVLTEDINLTNGTCVAGSSYISIYNGDGTLPDTEQTPEDPDTPPVDPSEYQQLNYSHVRGMWLSQFDLSNVFMSNSAQRSEASYRSLMTTILDNCKNIGINTLFVQVRPNGDSMYPSQYYTASKYVVGSYGKTHSYDPFAIIIEMAHARSMSVQAWINPLRLMSSTDIANVSTTYKVGEWYQSSTYNGKYVVLYSSYYYLNPAYEEVRQLIIDGAKEICTLYNIDGVHMDDYFYPTTSSTFDSAAYNAYTGSLSLANWRRDNLNKLVSGIYSAVKSVDKDILFGISPAGNMSTVYNSQYADVYTWCSTTGYIDYICPQVYFGMLHTTQGFGKCSTGWSNIVTSSSVTLYAGLTLGKALDGYNGTIDTYAGSTEAQYEWVNNRDVIRSSLEYVRDSLPKCTGVVFFCYQYFYSPTTGSSIAATAEERANMQPVLDELFKNVTVKPNVE